MVKFYLFLLNISCKVINICVCEWLSAVIFSGKRRHKHILAGGEFQKHITVGTFLQRILKVGEFFRFRAFLKALNSKSLVKNQLLHGKEKTGNRDKKQTAKQIREGKHPICHILHLPLSARHSWLGLGFSALNSSPPENQECVVPRAATYP